MKKVGEVSHFFTRLGVGVIELSGSLKEGSKIVVKGATTNFEQTVNSMEIDGEKVGEAKKGHSIGLKLRERARAGDEIFLAE